MRRLLEALGYGSGVVALAAALLAAASSRALGLDPDPRVLVLAGAGALAIYGLDRLRDVARDRLAAPERTAFVEAHGPAIAWSSGAAGAVAVAAGLLAGPAVTAVAAAVAAFGLAHRRLKQRWFAKPVYLVLSWTAVAVGLPLARVPGGQHALRVAAVVALAVWANVILSNLKDREGAAARIGPRRARGVALAACALSAALALAGPASVVSLAAVPAAMAVAVLADRRGELAAALCIDGALAAGAALALGWPTP